MDLIMREALIDEFEYYIEEAGWGDEWNRVIEEVALESVRNAPAIDAIPLINGHWIDLSRINQLLNTNVPVVHCNYCGISFICVANGKGYMYKYCPTCGKRLDGDAK